MLLYYFRNPLLPRRLNWKQNQKWQIKQVSLLLFCCKFFIFSISEFKSKWLEVFACTHLLLGGVEYCENKVSCPRKHHSVSPPGLNLACIASISLSYEELSLYSAHMQIGVGASPPLALSIFCWCSKLLAARIQIFVSRESLLCRLVWNLDSSH